MNTYILTGTTRGLGKALSIELSNKPYLKEKKIFINRKKSLIENIENLERIEIDLSDEEINTKKIALDKKTKQVVFINNASIIEPISKALDISIDDISESINVNYKSPFKISQHLASETKKLGIKLLIINITTGAAVRPIQGWLAYCTSKAAIKMALDVLAEENVHITVVHYDPGVMDTDMQASIRNASKNQMPHVEQFKNLKKINDLKLPGNVAKIICEIIADTLP